MTSPDPPVSQYHSRVFPRSATPVVIGTWGGTGVVRLLAESAAHAPVMAARPAVTANPPINPAVTASPRATFPMPHPSPVSASRRENLSQAWTHEDPRLTGTTPGGRSVLAALREVVAHGDAVARSQLELLLLGGGNLDTQPPDGLAGDAIRQHVRPWNHIGEFEATILISPENVTGLLGWAPRLPDQEQLEPPHRFRLGSPLGERRMARSVPFPACRSAPGLSTRGAAGSAPAFVSHARASPASDASVGALAMSHWNSR